ncbi:MAG TPA: winged helix-turn-helix domain-containing protein [Solirubrobacteraceae bacterium]|nr:winged helix-turn-helix domain-containing protein [Solirubrobacteraceae bacterium]
MAAPRSIGVEYASELSHPFRFRLVAALVDGPRTIAELTQQLGAPDAVVRHHVGHLRQLGFVEQDTPEDGPDTYELLTSLVISDEEWGAMPVEARRAAAATSLTHTGARAVAAIDRGGFDRDDIHITRTTVTVDEAGWNRLTELFHALLRELRERTSAPAPEGPAFQATGALMLFTDEQAERPAPPAAPPPDEDALSAADALMDGLSGALVESPVDWESVEVLAERLRLVARASKETPAAQVIPLRRDERQGSDAGG